MNYKKFMNLTLILTAGLSVLYILLIASICMIVVFADNESIIQSNQEQPVSTTHTITTTVVPVTSITTTTTVITTTTITTTEKTTTSEEEYIEEYYETEVVDDYKEDNTYIEPEEEYVEPEENNDENSGETYYGTFEATYYEGGVGTYGASGRDLISGYSIASNIFPQGSLIRIEGSGLDGIYRVDDRGGMPDNVLDFYYQYGDTPSDFQFYGRMNVEVYLIN